MGIFDANYGTQTSVTSKNIPAWLQVAGRENYDNARALTSQPYQKYGGPRVAPFTGDQEASFAGVRGNAGAWRPGMERAEGATAFGGRSLPQMDLSQYMNPFTDQVIDRTTAEIRRQGDINRKNIGLSKAMAGAYGGARHGVAEGVSYGYQNRAMGDIVAQLYAANFGNAQAMAASDAERSLRAGTQEAALADQTSRYGLRDAAGLQAIGEAGQEQTQKNYDVGYADFLRQLGWPFEMLNYRTSAMSGVPYEGKQTTVAPIAEANPFAQSVGLAATLAGLFN